MKECITQLEAQQVLRKNRVEMGDSIETEQSVAHLLGLCSCRSSGVVSPTDETEVYYYHE